MNSFGVVGKISEVGEKSSTVILLTDPQFSVAALVKGPRESGLVSGTLQGVCRLRYLKRDAQIEIGDQVITSKLSSSFPEHLIIGKIVRVIDDPNGQTIQGIVEPAVNFSQIEEVLVIIK